MKNLLIGVVFILLLVVGCKDPIYKHKVIEKYCRNSHYSVDSIYLRENNTFTKKDCWMMFYKNYYGTYKQSNDTIYFEYHGINKPKTELSFVIKKSHSIMVFRIYKRIKDEYSYLSAEELQKINRKDLMTKDTAMIEYTSVR